MGAGKLQLRGQASGQSQEISAHADLHVKMNETATSASSDASRRRDDEQNRPRSLPHTCPWEG